MLKIVKRPEGSHRRETLMRVSAVFFALVASAVIMALLGYNPFLVYAKIVEGSLMSAYRFRETIHKTIPLVVLSLGIAVAFKMKFWNIGAEGQLYMGAFGAALVAYSLPTLPSPLLLAFMMLVGAVFGGLWALIPALLKLKFSTSETLVTLMLNYIAIKWVSYLQYGPWKDPNGIGFPKMAAFSSGAVLPKVFGIHIGWIIALVLVVVIHILLKKSKLGYEIAVLGESDTTARYAGMSVAKITVTAVLISGGLCGLAGMMQASGIERTLNDQLSGGLGFTAVITCWLARLSAPAVVLVSFLFSVLIQGGAYLQSSMKIPSAVAGVLQGIILFFVLGSEFFIQYSVVFQKKKSAGEVHDA
ncbi:ABC transporter permease [Papillibacter cinnamivorans]|uniref:Nucleoside ABC transporter membrane protein n=1 Tax=Papillibacter cinnamivorans DSM 12816 TaxID=1122930 RepID=A0A1W2A3A7_9FIRM|nr:ABC transporter permease [Papillibacter cinnamivorans]SMC55116.1 nucleoside ABC transporter membrane protein [Papillibacter cinnamivorans DSM 12816]